jgi:putative glycosyltransferase (TIGR04372 family)
MINFGKIKIKTKVNFLLKNGFFTPQIILVLILSYIFNFRFYSFNVSRIGHLSEDLFVFLNSKKNKKCIIFLSHQYNGVCNKELLGIIKKRFFFYPSFLFEQPINIIKQIRYRYGIFNSINLVNKDFKKSGFENYNLKPVKLSYTEEQNKIFNDFLRVNKLSKGKYVCFSLWEKGHLKDKRQFSHHNHRLSNSNFKNYYKSINYLTQNGFKVVRIGINSSIKLNINHKNYIDFSYNVKKNEILDIMLLNYCKFFVTTTGGLDYLAFMFNKPMIVNTPIIDNVFSEKKNIIYLLRPHYCTKKKSIINIREIMMKRNLGFLPKYYFLKKNHIKILDNDKNEILSSIKDLLMLINDKKKYKKYYKISSIYWKNYLLYINKYHKNLLPFYKKIKCLYSPSLIKKNLHFYK